MVDMVTWQPGGETGHGRHGNLVERQRGLLISWDPQDDHKVEVCFICNKIIFLDFLIFLVLVSQENVFPSVSFVLFCVFCPVVLFTWF